MSMYAQFDENGPQEQIATNTGWSGFGDWADSLDVGTYPAVVQLWEHGHSTSLPDLERQLSTALDAHPPADEGTRAVARALLEAVGQNPDAEIVLITNGVRADNGEPDESQLEPGEVANAD